MCRFYRLKLLILSTSLLFTTVVVDCFILRLSCKKEADFIIAKENHALTNSVIANATVASSGECVKECVINRGCKSINYKKSGENNCELNSKIRDNSTMQHFKERKGWTYASTDYTDLKVGTVCKSLNPCPRGIHCVDTCNGKRYQCLHCKKNYKVKQELFCERKPWESCSELKREMPTAANGIYKLASGRHYCMMNELPDCGGTGGWTLAMKINGLADTFSGESEKWTDDSVYNVKKGLKAIDTEEAKFAAFNSLKFHSICVGMKIGQTTNMMLIPKSSTSLRQVFQDGNFQATNLGKAAWKNLVPGGGVLQRRCNKEGFNIKAWERIIARIGIIGNNENDCLTPDTFIGFGTYDHPAHSNIKISCGNLGNRGGGEVLPGMGFILIQ
eukprot:gene7738-8578_t